MSTITINEIPTIAQDYASGLLKRSKAPEFSFSASINSKISLWQGDITSLEIDGIQNAANKALRGGGGIDGAIHRAAGPDLLKYCKTLKGCPTGSTKISPGFDLPSKHVLHTVGPIYDDEEAEECEEELQGCYTSTLQLAVDNHLRTVALCGVSTGVYGYPLREATEVALRTTRTFLDEHEDKFERIIFCNFGNRDVTAYRQLAPTYFPPKDEPGSPEPAGGAPKNEGDAKLRSKAEAETSPPEGNREEDHAEESTVEEEQAKSRADPPGEEAVGKAQL